MTARARTPGWVAAGLALAVVACGGGDDGDDDDAPGACDEVAVDGEARAYGLPAGYVDGAFRTPAASPVCGGAAAVPLYVTADATGDGIPDLIITARCDDTTVGDTRWIVHPGGRDGFGAATSWDLPDGYVAGSFRGTAGEVACGGAGLPTYQALELTGDGRLDLVITRLCGDGTVGDTRWIVHAGQDGGFGPATGWALPGGYIAGAFARTAAEPVCGSGALPAYALADVDGDRRPDLVVTALCSDTSVGDAHWTVHRAGAAGFGAATTWALPGGYVGGAFRRLASQATCGSAAVPSYATTDLTGDRRADLVVTARCDDTAVGDTRWLVYPGGDDGFGAATELALPGGYGPSSFRTLAVSACSGTQPAFATFDLTGDRRVDVVVTARCDDTTVGDTRWIVHRGDAAGFAATGAAPLPAGYTTGSFRTTGAAPVCGNGPLPAFSLADLGGDGRPELVVTARCDDTTVGTTAWRVHDNRCVTGGAP